MFRSNLQSLESRLNRLERQNHQLKVSGCVIFSLVALVGVMGQTPSRDKQVSYETVQAEQFIVRSKAGELKAVLGMRRDGGPHLELFDSSLEPRLTLAILPDRSAAVSLIGIDGKSLALSVEAQKMMGLVLLDKDRNLRAELSLEGNSKPKVAIYGKNEKVLWSTP